MHNYTVIRKIFVAFVTSLFIFLSGNNILHASVNGYLFTQSYTTYTPAYGGTIIMSPGHNYTYGPYQIGFNFMYNGIQTHSFGVSDNGWLQFGSLVNPPNIILNLICSSGLPNVVCPFNGYLFGYTDTLRYSITGTAPFRVCTIEWCRYGFYSTAYEELSFEVKLYETTNVIQFIYHPINPTVTMENIQVGMVGNIITDYISRTTISDWTSTSQGTNCSYMYYVPPDVGPYEGLTYTFTPPGVCTKETFPFGYGFGANGLLDACWSFQLVNGIQNWLITSSSGNPQLQPYQGPFMAMFPSFGYSNIQARIKSPALNFATFPYPELTFYMSRDNMAPSQRDSLVVEASTNNGTSWIYLASYQRYSSSYPPYWEQKVVDLSQFSGYNNVIVGLRGIGLHGANILIDTILIKQIESIPVLVTSPASVTGAYTAKCGGTVTTNDPLNSTGVCWNTTGNPTISDPHTNDGIANLFTSYIIGLNANQLYHIRAFATNSLGTGYGNELTFTTCAATSTPYHEDFSGITTSGVWPCGWSNPNPNYATTLRGAGCLTPNSGEFYYSNSSKWVFTPGFFLTVGNHYALSVWYKTDGFSGWQTFRAKYGVRPEQTSMLPIEGAVINNPVNTECAELTGTFTPAETGYYYIGLNCIDNGTPWYFTFDDITLTDITGISKNENKIPETYCLYQNYPNPFNPETVIKFDIRAPLTPLPAKEGTGVVLKIYDLTGREVATILNEKLSPGTYEVNWNASGFASGVYFYKISTGDFTDSKKMVLMK